MKLINKSTRNYIAFDVVLEAGKVLDVTNSKAANILLTQPEVEEYVDIEEVKKLKEEAKKAKEEAKKAKEEAKKAKKAKEEEE